MTAAPETCEFPAGLLDLSARVIFVPVRHHSPACSRVVRHLAADLKPDAILIEGPSDFNDRIAELALPHRLPVALYTYARWENVRRGAYYPFCVYSPEWQALQAAQELGVPARFIDLPWSEMARERPSAHRYADGELRYSDYIAALCERVGVEDFDTLWDTLFEIDPETPVEVLLERCHRFCFQARTLDRHIPELDLHREAFMAEQIRAALAEFPGRILVVTGGFHSSALYERVLGVGRWALDAPSGDMSPSTPDADLPDAQRPTPDAQCPLLETGIALTPYSYERLDSLTGYDSGMPNPGFYHQVWDDRTREKRRHLTHRSLLAKVVRELRTRGQRFSTADLIAVETTAQALASLRGHSQVWRADLIDGILGALVKDELELGVPHPFLQAVYAVFRGGERGKLAEGTSLPPLVREIQRHLEAHGLKPELRERTLDLELTTAVDLARSRILHQLRGLGIPGYDRLGGTDLFARDDLVRYEEQWRIRWSPEFEAGCIEASLYGPTLEEAVEARLREQAEKLERNAEEAARLLLQSRMMGLAALAPAFHLRLVELIRQDGDFLGVSGALGHLLYLYRYDEVLGSAGDTEVGDLLKEAWSRALWLLETLGRPAEEGPKLLDGIRALLHAQETCGRSLDLGREELVSVLSRIAAEDAQAPVMRGAAAGALWNLGEADRETLLAGIRYCAEPDRLGDYLTGLFYLARETIQRETELVLSIDGLLSAYSDSQFLEALPALRLAFSFFTPREKHHLARTLLEALGLADTAPLAALEVTPEEAARALALEAAVFEELQRYGLRGASTPNAQPPTPEAHHA